MASLDSSLVRETETKLKHSILMRPSQARIIEKDIDTSPYDVLVTGDFNDNPISYTHRTIAKDLTDCYVSTGKGPGWSYARGGMRVRIDNILCSDEWEPYGAKVDTKVTVSDHYPVYCWLKMK